MTEAQLRTSRDPWDLYRAVDGRLSDRQVRLWACAFARLAAAHFGHRLCGPTLDLAERTADGLVASADRHRAWLAVKSAARAARQGGAGALWWGSLGSLVLAVVRDAAHAEVRRTIRTAITDAGRAAYVVALAAGGGPSSAAAHRAGRDAQAAADAAMCDRLRDVAGGPAGPPSFPAAWRTTDVLGLARGLYEDAAFDRLPVLSDALLDAGCDDPDFLGHCRSVGPHVKGCWVVDLVLGKE